MSDTRPSPDTPEELIWLRGFEAGVIRCRADRNQVIQELIDWKAEAAPIEAKHRSQVIQELIVAAEAESPYISMDDLIDGRDAFAASVWLKSQMEGE